MRLVQSTTTGITTGWEYRFKGSARQGHPTQLASWRNLRRDSGAHGEALWALIQRADSARHLARPGGTAPAAASGRMVPAKCHRRSARPLTGAGEYAALPPQPAPWRDWGGTPCSSNSACTRRIRARSPPG